jgi:hypothetical protein
MSSSEHNLVRQYDATRDAQQQERLRLPTAILRAAAELCERVCDDTMLLHIDG